LLFSLIKIIQNDITLFSNIIPAVAISIVLILINIIYTKYRGIEAIGFGDVKLIAILFLVIKFPLSFLVLWFASLLGIIFFAIKKYFFQPEDTSRQLPFAFFISISSIPIIIFKNTILNIILDIISYS
jgi:leader peptidase (prepilin peptidase)/N-methyltransferase